MNKIYKRGTIFDLKIDELKYGMVPTEYPNVYVVRIPISDTQYIYRLGHSGQTEKMLHGYVSRNPIAEICGVSYVPDATNIINGINTRNEKDLIYGWYFADTLKTSCEKFSFITHREFIEIKNGLSITNKSITYADLVRIPSSNSPWFDMSSYNRK